MRVADFVALLAQWRAAGEETGELAAMIVSPIRREELRRASLDAVSAADKAAAEVASVDPDTVLVFTAPLAAHWAALCHARCRVLAILKELFS